MSHIGMYVTGFKCVIWMHGEVKKRFEWPQFPSCKALFQLINVSHDPVRVACGKSQEYFWWPMS